MNLSEMSSPEVAALSRDIVILIPVGSLEQHGQHLPVFTDTLIVDAIASAAESAMSDRLLRLPTQWMGASAHHLAYPGTVTANLDTHIRLLQETAEGLLRHGFRRFFILNGHSGNLDTLRVANRQLKIDWPDGSFAGASYWDLAIPEIVEILTGPRKEIGHSCEMETALMLALHPEKVRLDKIRDDPIDLPEALRKVSLVYNFEEATESGQIGYAASATAETGRRLLDAVIRKTLDALNAFYEGDYYRR